MPHVVGWTQHSEGELMAHQPSGWYTDPTSKYSYRFWNGSQWTNQVSTGGKTGADPDPMGADAATAQPAPGKIGRAHV